MIGYIYSELQANPALKRVGTTIVLRPEQITPDLERDALTDSVQLGLRAGMPEQGRFLVESEQLVVRFQRMVLSALA